MMNKKSLPAAFALLSLLAFSYSGVAQDRGMYFSKKTYAPEPLPKFSDHVNDLPRPILEDSAEWVNMYYKAWSLAFDHMRAPAQGSPFVSNWYDEAFDGNIYQWDIIFMTLFGRYAHHIFPGIQSLDNFYCRQHVSGSISRTIGEASGNDVFDENSTNLINPPLFSWAEVESFKVTGDTSRFAAVLPALEKYYEFVHSKRHSGDTPHKLYWSNGQSSGMDNTPRDNDRPSTHWASDHQGWVDASAQMVIQCNNIATICDELGEAEKAKTYRAKAQVIADSMNSWMWSEEDGIYYDVKVDGTKMAWKSIAAFWPMLAGVTTPRQDSALAAHLRDTGEFWRDMVFPTLSKSHSEYHANGGYWLGAVWAPTNYAVIKGLEKVGNNELAHEASERYLNGLYRVYRQTGTLWENYAPDKVDGKFKQGVNDQNPPSDCRKDFVGWTGLGPVSLLLENVLGFRVDGVSKTLTYDLRRTDRHGVENLRMADITTSVIAENRSDDPQKVSLTVRASKPYTLKVIADGGKVTEYEVLAGAQDFFMDLSSSSNSDTVSVGDTAQNSLVVGGNARSATPEVTLYPNPASDYVTLGGVPANEPVQLFDVSGRLWINARTSVANERLYVGRLPAGTYVGRTSKGQFKIIKRE
jgi:hypothetical protein